MRVEQIEVHVLARLSLVPIQIYRALLLRLEAAFRPVLAFLSVIDERLRLLHLRLGKYGPGDLHQMVIVCFDFCHLQLLILRVSL